MTDQETLNSFLATATVDGAVFDLRPDYRAALIAVRGLEAGASDDASEQLLVAARWRRRGPR